MDNHQGPIIFGLGSIFTTYVIKKMKLDTATSYGLVYSTITGLTLFLFSKFSSFENYRWFDFQLELLNNTLIYYFVILATIIGIGIYYRIKIKNKFSNTYTTITIYENDTINDLVKYFMIHNNYILHDYDLNIGDSGEIINQSNWKYLDKTSPDLDTKIVLNIIISNNITPKNDYPIKFYDPDLKIAGQLTWKSHEYSVGNTPVINLSIKYLEFQIENLETTKYHSNNHIIQNIKNKLTEIEKNDLVLEYIKVIDGKNHKVTIYDGKKYTMEHAEKMYMHTFFTKKKIVCGLFLKIYKQIRIILLVADRHRGQIYYYMDLRAQVNQHLRTEQQCV